MANYRRIPKSAEHPWKKYPAVKWGDGSISVGMVDADFDVMEDSEIYEICKAVGKNFSETY